MDMIIKEHYENLLKEYRKELIAGAFRDKQYEDLITHHQDVVQKLTHRVHLLLEDNLALKGYDKHLRFGD